MKHHIHPITILSNLWRVLFLIIIPVLRGFILALQGSLTEWASGAWIDILIFLLMIGFAVARWWAVSFEYNDIGIRIDRGIVFRSSLVTTWDRVTTISVTRSFYLKPVHGVHLFADTPGGGGRRADVKLLLLPGLAADVMKRCRAVAEGEGPVGKQYIPSASSIWAMALLTSSSFGGIVFIATFISQSGKLLGNEFADMIVGAFEHAARMLAFGIPPAAAAIAYILLAGWLIGLMLTLIRYKDFTVTRRAQGLNITSGIFTNREYNLKYSAINFVDIRYSIFTKLLRMPSLYISVIGYGKQKDDISCIIPTEGIEQFRKSRKMLFAAFRKSARQLHPLKVTSIFRYISDPAYFCLGIPLAMVVAYYFVPGWSQFILFVGLMSLVPSVLFMAVRIMDFKTGGIGYEKGYYTVRYSKGVSLHTVIFSSDKLVKVRIRQSLIQRFGNNCDLIVYTKAEGAYRHLCRNLDRTQVIDFFQL